MSGPGHPPGTLSPVQPHPAATPAATYSFPSIRHWVTRPEPQPHPGGKGTGQKKGTGIRDHYDIMVSYSRKNKDFAERLVAELEQLGHKIWVDWKCIPPGSDWRSQIEAGIEGADSALFVLTPDWTQSAECQKELDLASKASKKLIPVLRENTRDVPEELAAINWVYMRMTDNFNDGVQKIDTVAKVDLDLIRLHTRYLIRSKEWMEAGGKKNSAKLLTGKDLREAVDWRERVKESGRAVRVTEEQEKFIATSAQRAKLKKIVIITVSVIAIAAIVAAAIAAVIAAIEASKARDEAQKQESIAKATSAALAVANANLTAAYNSLNASNTALAAAYSDLATKNDALIASNKALALALAASSQRQAVGSGRANFEDDKQLAMLLGVLSTNATQFTDNAQNLASAYNALRDFIFGTQGTYIEGAQSGGVARRRRLAGEEEPAAPAASSHAAMAAAAAAAVDEEEEEEREGKRARVELRGAKGRARDEKGGLRIGRNLLAGAAGALNLREIASSSKQQYTLVFPMVAFSENTNYLANVVLLRWQEYIGLEADRIKVRIAANVWDVSNDRRSKPVVVRTIDYTYQGRAVDMRNPSTKRIIPFGITDEETEIDLDGFVNCVVDFNGNVFLRTVSFATNGIEVTSSRTRDRFFVNLPNGTWKRYDAAITPGKLITGVSVDNLDLRLVSTVKDWTELPGIDKRAPSTSDWVPKDAKLGTSVLLSTATCTSNGREGIFAWPRESVSHSNIIHFYVYDPLAPSEPIKLWARFDVTLAVRDAYGPTGIPWNYNNDRMTSTVDCNTLFVVANDKIKVGGDSQGNAAIDGEVTFFVIYMNIPTTQLPTTSLINITSANFNKLANYSFAKPPLDTLSAAAASDYPRIKDQSALLLGFVPEVSDSFKNQYQAASGFKNVASAGFGAVFATKMKSTPGYDPSCVRHTLYYSTLTALGASDKFGQPVSTVWPITDLDCSYGDDLNAFGAQRGAISVHTEAPFVAVGTQTGTLKVYDTRNGLYATPLETLSVDLFTGAVRAVSFSQKTTTGTVLIAAGDIFGNFILATTSSDGFTEPVARQTPYMFDMRLTPRASSSWRPAYRLRPARGLFSPASAGCAFALVGDAAPAMWRAGNAREPRSTVWVFPQDKTRNIGTDFVDPCLSCNTDISKNARTYGWAPDGRLLGFMSITGVIAWKNSATKCTYPANYAQDAAWSWTKALGMRDLLPQEVSEPIAWTKAGGGSGWVAAAGVVYPILANGNPDTSAGQILVDPQDYERKSGKFFMSSAAAFSSNGSLLAGCLNFIEPNAAGTGMCKISKNGADCSTLTQLYLARRVGSTWTTLWIRDTVGFSSSRCRRALVSSNIDPLTVTTTSVVNGTNVTTWTTAAVDASSTPFLLFDTRTFFLVVPFNRTTLEPLLLAPNIVVPIRMTPSSATAPEGVPADPEDYPDYSAAVNASKTYDPQGPAFTDVFMYIPANTAGFFVTGRSVVRYYRVSGTNVTSDTDRTMTFATPYEIRASQSGRFLVVWSSYSAVTIYDLATPDPAAYTQSFSFGKYYTATRRTARLPVLPFISDEGTTLGFLYYPPDSTKLLYETANYLNSGYDQTLKLRLVDLSSTVLAPKACSMISRDISSREYGLIFNETKPFSPCAVHTLQNYRAAAGDPCKARGTYDDKIVACQCTAPYSGTYCDEQPQPDTCKNGGKADPINGACSCAAGWYGLTCELVCPGGGDCSSVIAGRL